MSELWLKFNDIDGEGKRVRVDDPVFVVGRHSASNLCIVDSRLSREHLKIERSGDLFIATDCGSSNGTKINNAVLDSPVTLKDGDALDLGGLKIQTELEAAPVYPDQTPDALSPIEVVPVVTATGTAASYAEPHGSSIPTSIFFIAPILGILVLSMLAGLIYFTSGTTTAEVTTNEFQYSDYPDDPPAKKKTAKESETSPAANKTSSANNVATSGSNATADLPPAPPADSDAAKVEQNGTAFLRKAAQNDAKAFLTGEQAKKVAARVKQLSGNPAIAANISSARQNASQINSLSKRTNLQPAFLAAAAIARLGSSRGDIAKTAESMSATLDKLRTSIGSELADDALLMIAAYDQAEGGDSLKMRNMLQDLSNKFPDSSRSIRTIWFLQQNGKITQSEFDAAVTFLAIGTISQNPKAFGVNAEALSF